MSGWSSPISRLTSSASRDVGGLEAEHVAPRRRGPPGPPARASSARRRCAGGSRRCDQSALAEPTIVKPGQELARLGQLGDRRHQQAAGEIAGGSEEDHVARSWGAAFLRSSAIVVGRWLRQRRRAAGRAYRGDGGPVTPGRHWKIAPARGWAARPLRLEVEPRGRDVEVAAVAATEGHRGGVRRRQLDDAVERAVGPVAVDGPGVAPARPTACPRRRRSCRPARPARR